MSIKFTGYKNVLTCGQYGMSDCTGHHNCYGKINSVCKLELTALFKRDTAASLFRSVCAARYKEAASLLLICIAVSIVNSRLSIKTRKLRCGLIIIRITLFINPCVLRMTSGAKLCARKNKRCADYNKFARDTETKYKVG